MVRVAVNPFFDVSYELPLLYVGIAELVCAVNEEAESELGYRTTEELEKGSFHLVVGQLFSASQLRHMKQITLQPGKLVREE